MYTITLRGSPYARGVQQGKAYAQEMQALYAACPAWLGDFSPKRLAAIRDTMVAALRRIFPPMAEELEGLAAGSGMPFEDVCTLNFVSAIGALKACTNLIALHTEAGPALAKTSDIGDDYRFYCLQRVEPDQGYDYFAISWAGCLWAEVGVNSAGLAAGQGSGPTMPGQAGEGIPTLEYPRVILETCQDVEEAIRFCQETPMAGKGLNIALVDAGGNAAVVEKSGTKAGVRRPLAEGAAAQAGTVAGGVYCANHFIESKMQGMEPLAIPGLPSIPENSQKRLNHVGRFFQRTPAPRIGDLVDLLRLGLETGGLLQEEFPALTTYYAYIVLPALGEMRISAGIPHEGVPFTAYRLDEES